MFTKSDILKEMENLPADKLEEIYAFVHSITSPKPSTSSRKKIMSFAGMFSEMSEKEYNDFKKVAKKTRRGLFNREVDI